YTARTLSLHNGFEHMVLSGSGKTDFDGISYYGKGERDIISHMNGKSGEIDLTGMEMVKLAPKGDIFLTPDSTGVKAMKGGDFSYGGSVTLGLFTVKGNAAYKYSENKIDLSGASQMSFRVPSGNGFADVKNTIDSLKGSIVLNAPDNKAQRGKTEQYPMLITTDVSYVFYPHLDSIYSRKELFVAIEPFTLDSLSSRNTKGIHFDGTVHTGDIVPPFVRTVSVQKDMSLGFEKADFSRGVSFYGKGTFYGKVSLLNSGLWGYGKYQYLSSTVTADSTFLMPNKASCIADVAVEESVQYNTPQMSFKNAITVFMPYENTLSVKTDSIAGSIYSDEMTFKGTVNISPTINTASGIIKTDISTLVSDTIFLSREKITSPRMDITFGTALFPTKVEVKNAKAVIEPVLRSALFTMNDPFSSTYIPEDSVLLHLTDVRWDMERGTVDFSSDKKDGKITLFYPSDAPLSFSAQNVQYHINTDSMAISGIKNLHVGDALIVPNASTLHVISGGKLEPLSSCEIFLDTTNRRHRLYGATVEIISEKKMSGSASYDYTDADGVVYPMLFSSITVDENGQTVAMADTYTNEDYPLGAYFLFRGKSTLRGSSEGLGLRGSLRPVVIECPRMDIGSMEIDTKNANEMFFTPFQSSYTNGIIWDKGTFSGAFLVNDSTKMNVFSSVNAPIHHDDILGAFIISDTVKGSYPHFAFYSDECRLDVRGDIFINDPSGHLKSLAAGSSSLDMNSGKLKIEDMAVGLRVDFPKDLSDAVASFVSSLGKLNVNEKESAALNHIAPFTENSDFTFVLSGISAKTDEESATLVSSGDITVNAVCGVPVFSVVSGKMSIAKSPSGGDDICIYMKNDTGDDFLFFRYKNGTADFLCSNADIMKTFDSLTEKYKNTLPDAYSLRRATKARVLSFVQ
ncbi:MAG: hypothetical protein PHD21_06335, partial [Flavobacteriales bacterium]|nr:hypothetical protein [Flavobacteriales bacterium]